MNHSAVFWFVPFPDMPSIIWFIVNRRESYIEWHIELSWTIPCGLFSPEELNLDFIWPFFPKSMIPDSSRTTWSDTRTWIKSRVGHEGYLIAHLDQRNGFCCAKKGHDSLYVRIHELAISFFPSSWREGVFCQHKMQVVLLTNCSYLQASFLTLHSNSIFVIQFRLALLARWWMRQSKTVIIGR